MCPREGDLHGFLRTAFRYLSGRRKRFIRTAAFSDPVGRYVASEGVAQSQTSGLGNRHKEEGSMATKTRSDLPEEPPAIIFKATVTQINAATTTEVPIS